MTTDYFRNSFRARNTKLSTMDSFWKKIYTPTGRHSEGLSSLTDPITIEEWHETLSKLNSDSAAGLSGCDYITLKKFPSQLHAILVTFCNWSLSSGTIPLSWKRSMIFPIPKPKPFNYDLNNVRPIALLDTVRKTCTKLITERLSSRLSDLKILKGLNFCGLKSESTSAPIQIINCLIEDAKDNHKELYLVTQDMKKAYDSVSLQSLMIALQRIDLPASLVKWIINLFKNREMQIITDYGLSPLFSASDGIDQGDALSPLLWRIFYDPLLVAIQSTAGLGYTTLLTLLTDPSVNRLTVTCNQGDNSYD